jgi:hypothetical protein
LASQRRLRDEWGNFLDNVARLEKGRGEDLVSFTEPVVRQL